ncbi:toll/interleukin-1 receptor domain-containing protein [Gracilimonas amylolytica]|jgi:hypothetical protein|uniref:toll/interleukin-1 receptor domain-containing protein n=1 Tax=Gracilimonas amylolytica TaxID=1749045 RepID=UPI000CD8309D|nr:toll/interleukin-1 receptor domain-containing protein [Gracilimonas amylolytica]
MQSNLSKTDINDSLRHFKNRRDDLLHEDSATFDHYLERFLDFCKSDLLVQKVLNPLDQKYTVDADGWWEEVKKRNGSMEFPQNLDEELLLRYKILESLPDRSNDIYFLPAKGSKKDDYLDYIKNVIARPFAVELTHRLGDVADLASPEARMQQAVPLNRIPKKNKIKVFLSHKSVDKPLVKRFYNALKVSGFDPWLDEPNMAAGTNLERELLKGFEESCAAVFFITENFKDEKYLATEVDYAIIQKRKKEKKFAIITLRYSNAAPVPGLLDPYIYKNIENDLEGFYELVRALPIELGPLRWKKEVVD